MRTSSPSLREWLRQGPFTLALSSSFFGFYAHCGVLAALAEHAPMPRKLTGASAGALVGGAIASGLTPKEARELLFSVKKSDFWDPGLGFGLLRGRKFLRIVEENYVADFAHAKIPLEAAALDVLSMRTHFLREGSLPKAVVASCAVPLMFHPVRIGRRVYLDGGVFHKSGLRVEHPEERVLNVFLVTDRFIDSYERGGEKLGRTLGPAQKVLRLQNLPTVDPNRLERGQEAYEAAYRRTRAALDLPVTGTILDS